MTPGAKPIPLGRLRWLCRRGTKELDRILGGFLEEDYHQATATAQIAFQELLLCQDPDIYDWLMGVQSPEEPSFIELIQFLRNKFGLSA